MTLAPETLINTVELAGAFTMVLFADPTCAAVTAKTFRIGSVPVKVSVVETSETLPVAGNAPSRVDCWRRKVPAAVKSSGVPWRVVPFGTPMLVRLAVPPWTIFPLKT